MLKDNFCIVGIGQGGGKMAKEFCDNKYRSFFINTSYDDLSQLKVTDDYSYHIPSAKGCAKSRDIAINYAKNYYEQMCGKLLDTHPTANIFVIHYTLGGGTGGGTSKVSYFSVNANCLIDGVWNGEGIDASAVTSLTDKFYNIPSLIKIEGVDKWDISSVNKMQGVFRMCQNLQSIDDVSGWNTGNVTDISNMFNNCNLLENLNLSGWDVSSVTNMSNMFYYCKSLQSVGDLSGWDVSSVTNMSYMFSLNSITQIDLSGWNTGNVTDMSYMFSTCSSLTQIDISGWNASNVTNLYNFSQGCNINTYVGGRTIDEVIENNISIFNGLNTGIANSGTYNVIQATADRASLRALINGLADRTGQTSRSLNLGSILTAKLTQEDIAIATAKNWTIA